MHLTVSCLDRLVCQILSSSLKGDFPCISSVKRGYSALILGYLDVLGTPKNHLPNHLPEIIYIGLSEKKVINIVGYKLRLLKIFCDLELGIL